MVAVPIRVLWNIVTKFVLIWSRCGNEYTAFPFMHIWIYQYANVRRTTQGNIYHFNWICLIRLSPTIMCTTYASSCHPNNFAMTTVCWIWGTSQQSQKNPITITVTSPACSGVSNETFFMLSFCKCQHDVQHAFVPSDLVCHNAHIRSL